MNLQNFTFEHLIFFGDCVFLACKNALFSKSKKNVSIVSGYGELVIGPSARSGYLCRKAARKRGEVCREGAVQYYPDLARGDSKKSIFLLVEIDSVRSQLSPFSVVFHFNFFMACITYTCYSTIKQAKW